MIDDNLIGAIAFLSPQFLIYIAVPRHLSILIVFSLNQMILSVMIMMMIIVQFFLQAHIHVLHDDDD